MGTRSPTPRRATESAAAATTVRYAVVGLGHIAQVAILPAFAQAQQNSKLTALVSDDPEKLRKLSRRYGISRVCSYDDADDLFESGDVDAVYVTLPNSMHREYTERAARAGLHVLCEKPMAVTSADCERMIEITRENAVKLMIAYRLCGRSAFRQRVKEHRGGRRATCRGAARRSVICRSAARRSAARRSAARRSATRCSATRCSATRCRGQRQPPGQPHNSQRALPRAA